MTSFAPHLFVSSYHVSLRNMHFSLPPSTCNQYATTHDERNAYPSCYRNRLVENKHSCQHAKYIAKRYHRISHGKGKVLDNVHPEDCCRSIADPTTEKPPVGKLARKEMYSPRESSHLLECKLKQNLSSTEQHTLHNGYQKQSHRAVYLISALSSLPTPCQISTAVITYHRNGISIHQFFSKSQIIKNFLHSRG